MVSYLREKKKIPKEMKHMPKLGVIIRYTEDEKETLMKRLKEHGMDRGSIERDGELIYLMAQYLPKDTEEAASIFGKEASKIYKMANTPRPDEQKTT